MFDVDVGTHIGTKDSGGGVLGGIMNQSGSSSVCLANNNLPLLKSLSFVGMPLCIHQRLCINDVVFTSPCCVLCRVKNKKNTVIVLGAVATNKRGHVRTYDQNIYIYWTLIYYRIVEVGRVKNQGEINIKWISYIKLNIQSLMTPCMFNNRYRH
jgi:hypothetical protein